MKKNKKTEKEPRKILVLGELDIILKIDFREEDLLIKNEEENEKSTKKRHYKLKNISEISSLFFIHNNDELIKRIQLTSKNNLIKLILIGNLNSEKISIIDYICFGFPIFSEEELFFYDILNSVSKKYGIYFNKKPLNINAGYKIKIEMTYEEQKKEILIESEGKHEHEEDNDIKEEGESPQDDEDFLEDDSDDDYPLNNAMINNLIPKFKRKNILCNMNPLFAKYDMLLFNFDDLKNISKNFKIEYTLELIDFLKKKKTIIFVNYYTLEKYIDKDNEKNNDTIHKKGKSKIKSKEKPLEKINPDKSKKSLTKNSYLELINKFYYVTDIYFFDKKQAIKSFSEHYKYFTTDDSKKLISSKNVFDYFIKGISTGTESEVPNDKTGIFLDEFNEFCLIQVSKNSVVYKQEYDPHPFPKINTHNIKEVSEYKEIIKKNKNEFYFLFLSKFIISISQGAQGGKNFSPPTPLPPPSLVYPAYLTGMDLIKKKIECIKNKVKIEESEEKFYKIKTHPKILSQELEKLSQGEKEEKFLLDCTNKITSNKKEYISLFDFHLKNFFSSEIIRKDLENKGFIDSEGYILYDPLYKDVMGINAKKKKFTEKQMKEKIIENINDIKIQTMMNDKNINDINLNLFINDNFNISTEKKIPFIKEKNEINIKKKKNNQKGFGFGENGYHTGINYNGHNNNILDENRKTK